MLTKIKKVKFNQAGTNPNYKVILECPAGKRLFVHFDYMCKTKSYGPVEVSYNGVDKGVKLAWYTRDIEKITVKKFLETIAQKINRKYGYELKEQ